MRVLHLFANWKWTGPAEHAVNLAAGLARRGHEVTFVPGRPVRGLPCRLADEARARGLPVREGLGLGKHFRLFENHRDARRLLGWLREMKPDFVHVHTLNDHLVGGAAARRYGRDLPVVRSVYDGEVPGSGWRTRLAFGRRTDALLSASERVREGIIGRFDFPEERSFAAEVPVDLHRFDPGRDLPDLRGRYGIGAGDYVVGIVARMQRHRRYEVFFDALRRVHREVPSLRVLVVGRGTHMEDVGVRAARATPLAGRVVFTGYLSGNDYVATLGAMDVKVFLVPGSDGACRAVREALAMGKPVVAADTGMLPEIIADGETGLLVPVEADALARALVALADPGHREAMSRRAREEAVRRFDPARHAAAVEAVYREITQAGRAGDGGGAAP